MTGKRKDDNRRGANMRITPEITNPYIVERAPRTFTDGPLATPIAGDLGWLSLFTQPAEFDAGHLEWEKRAIVARLDKLPLLCKELGLLPPTSFDEPGAAILYAMMAVQIAREFVPGFRTVLEPFPRKNEKGRHGKTREDEKWALGWFWAIRDWCRPSGKRMTDREAWAIYAETVLDKSLAGKSREARAERARVSLNLHMKMAHLVAAQRQQKKAGRAH
jgi:hypothetical protein